MWEAIGGPCEDRDNEISSHRLKVHGGWIIRTIVSRYKAGACVCQTFVADAEYMWQLEGPAPVKKG